MIFLIRNLIKDVEFYLVRSYFPVGADESQVAAGIVFAGQDLFADVKNGPRHKALGDATPEKGNIWGQ